MEREGTVLKKKGQRLAKGREWDGETFRDRGEVYCG